MSKVSERLEAFRNDPASVYMTLAAFKIHSDFTHAEMMGELSSGRLVASAPKDILSKAYASNKVNAAEWIIDCEALLNWMTNPETPSNLLAKLERNFERVVQ